MMTHPTRLLKGVLVLGLFSTSSCATTTIPQALSSPLGPVVNVGYAAFAGNTTSPTGVVNGPVTFFGGIPYAQPPLGNFRFRAPVMLNENSVAHEVMDARNWGPACVQRPAVVGIGSEGQTSYLKIYKLNLLCMVLDCLTLNVWKPTNLSAGAKLPVVVYIHVRPSTFILSDA